MAIYGGWSATGYYALEDVYVLTMPSFLWIKVSDTGNAEKNLAENIGRRGHFCNTYQDRSMIMLGGAVFNRNSYYNRSSCNPQYPPIKLLDLTTFQWQNQYPLPNTTYSVPPQIYNAIGGGPNGGATTYSPLNGFTDPSTGPSLSSLFSKRVALYDPTTSKYITKGPPSLYSTNQSTNTTANGTSPLPPPSSSPAPSTHPAAIAGGVVGGIAGISLIALTIILILRQRKKSKATPTEWQKPELASQSAPPPWAGSRPSHQTHEVDGGDGGKLWPQEMDVHDARQEGGPPHEVHGEGSRGELDGWGGVQLSEGELAHEMPGSMAFKR